jgi:hypothetical protein
MLASIGESCDMASVIRTRKTWGLDDRLSLTDDLSPGTAKNCFT